MSSLPTPRDDACLITPVFVFVFVFVFVVGVLRACPAFEREHEHGLRRPGGKLAAMNIAELTGFEIMRRLVEGTLPPPSIMDTMSMKFGEVRKGYVKFVARADHRHLNPMGGVHGGFAATVLDSVTGCAVHTMLDAGVGYGTVDLNIKMLRPVPRDVELVAESNVLHVSRSLGVSDGTLKTADGKLLAHATATCYVFRADGK